MLAAALSGAAMHDFKRFLASKIAFSASDVAAAILLVAGLTLFGFRVFSAWPDKPAAPEFASTSATPEAARIDPTPTGSIAAPEAATTVLDPCTGLRK